MLAFHFPQNFEKQKICELIVTGLNAEFRGYVESIHPRELLGLLFRTRDEVWNFLETLTWNTYEFEQFSKTLGYPTQSESLKDDA